MLNFIGCCVVFIGVILYKIVVLMEKEEKKAKTAVAMEKDLAEKAAPQDKERQALHNNGTEENWGGIEMRRSGPSTRRGHSFGEDIG